MGKLAAIRYSSTTYFRFQLFMLILTLSGFGVGCRGPWFKKTDNFEPLMVTEQPEARSPRAFASTRLRPSPGADSHVTAPRPNSTSRQVSDARGTSFSDEEAGEGLPDDGTLTPEQRSIFEKQMAAIQNAAIKNKVTADLLEGNEQAPNTQDNDVASDDSTSHSFSLSDNDESPANQNSAPSNSEKPIASTKQEAAKEKGKVNLTETAPHRKTEKEQKLLIQQAGQPKASLPEGKVIHAGANSAIKNGNDNASANSNAVSLQSQPGDWRMLAQESLAALQAEADSATTLSPAQKLEMETKKRMLSLLLDDLEGAMTPIEFLAPDERDYFTHQFQALHAAIDPKGNPVINRRWTIALQSQRKAQTHLSAVSNLEVQNVAFCTEVDSFGIISKFPQYHFRRDQELLLYCELDNFVAEKLKNEYETKLQGSYEIVDSNGRRVADQMLPPDVHVCSNQRRDYFIAYRMYMPQEIAPGRYSLKLTIEDMKGHKFGQSSVDFQIVQ